MVARSTSRLRFTELIMRIVADPDVIADPYPLLRELRETSPVHKTGFADYWVLTRFDDCRAVLRDLRFGAPEPANAGPHPSALCQRTARALRSEQ